MILYFYLVLNTTLESVDFISGIGKTSQNCLEL